jgi:uncharacterized protein YrrD
VPDPVAWKVVEQGWDVVASDGERIGVVDQILGDPEADIFDGLSVTEGLLKATRYVPSEQVGAILDGEVHLALDSKAFAQLPTR